MKNSLARGAAVAFMSAASILPVAGGAHAAAAHDIPSAVSAWTHDQDHGGRCERFGHEEGRGEGEGRWGGEGREGGEGRWGGEGRGEGEGGWGGGWWGGRDWCGPWGVNSVNKWTKFSRLDWTSIRNSAIVILR